MAGGSGGPFRPFLWQFPQFCVFQKRVVSVERGEDQAVAAIAEALLNDEDFKEHRHRTADEPGERGPLVHIRVTLRHQSGVTLQLCRGDFHGVPGILQDMLVEVAKSPVQCVTLVHQLLVVAQLRSIEHLGRGIIGIPAAMPHPVTEEMASARNVIGVELRRGQFTANLGGQLRSATFVGVETEYPVVLRGVEGEVAEFAETAEFFADDAGVELPGDLDRAVGAERIDQDDFVRPLHRFEHGANLAGFVEREGVGGDWPRCSHVVGGPVWRNPRFFTMASANSLRDPLTLSLNRPFVLVLVLAPVLDRATCVRGRGRERLGSWSQCAILESWKLSMNRPLTPSLSPSAGERVVHGPSACAKSESRLSMNLRSRRPESAHGVDTPGAGKSKF